MTITDTPRNARIEFKTSSEVKALLQKAANTMGMDLSSFLIATATQRAQDILLKEQMLTLTEQEWKAFQESLSHPPKATKELKKLMSLESFDA